MLSHLFTFAALCARFVSEATFCVSVVDFRRFLFHEATVFSSNYASCIKIIFVMHYNAWLMVMFMSEESAGKWTSIRVRKETVSMLKELGRKGETYDDIIRRLIERVTRRRRKVREKLEG